MMTKTIIASKSFTANSLDMRLRWLSRSRGTALEAIRIMDARASETEKLNLGLSYRPIQLIGVRIVNDRGISRGRGVFIDVRAAHGLRELRTAKWRGLTRTFRAPGSPTFLNAYHPRCRRPIGRS